MNLGIVPAFSSGEVNVLLLALQFVQLWKIICISGGLKHHRSNQACPEIQILTTVHTLIEKNIVPLREGIECVYVCVCVNRNILYS